MKIFGMEWKMADILRPAAIFAWIFFTFPFWFLVMLGIWGAREVWSFVGFAVYAAVFFVPIVYCTKWKKRILVMLILGSVVILGTVGRIISLEMTPEKPQGKLQSVFLDGASPLVYTPFFFFSERDLIRIGSIYILGFNPQGRNLDLSNGINGKYDQMAKDPDFSVVKSEYLRAFDDMMGIQHKGAHYYRYVPTGGGGDRLVVYLHGSVGNFMMYPWMFRDLSERSNSTMTYVSFGYGEWDWKGGVETVKSVIDNELQGWKRTHPEATGLPKITLIGLSRGGTGITRFLKKYPGMIEYFAPISAVLEPEVMNTKEFITALKQTKTFILHGKEDDNVPVEGAYILEKIARDNRASVSVMYPEYGDHFTMFDHQKEFDDMMMKLWGK